MPILYHYRTPQGLQGILDSKSFWASDSRFLNDTSEFGYGMNKIVEAIRRYEDDIRVASVEGWSLISGILENFAGSKAVALVASFTSEGDLLSQWRGYNNGRGFSIGIDDEWLRKNASKQDFVLFPVRYDLDSQEKAVDIALKRLIGELEEADNRTEFVHSAVTDWWEGALRVALALKDKHFSEEKEHRLARVSRFWPDGTKVRSTYGGLVPYLPCKIDQHIINEARFHPKNLGFERIIVGPALKANQIARCRCFAR